MEATGFGSVFSSFVFRSIITFTEAIDGTKGLAIFCNTFLQATIGISFGSEKGPFPSLRVFFMFTEVTEGAKNLMKGPVIITFIHSLKATIIQFWVSERGRYRLYKFFNIQRSNYWGNLDWV